MILLEEMEAGVFPPHGLKASEIIVDSFAGGGGASQGILWALGRSPDIAINHDLEAIALHKANHPESLHLAEDVWKVNPVAACAGRPVGLMWLSPDCKHFSKAKGGKPVSKKIRGLAWIAVRWAKAVKPRVIVLENVEEFQTWGPVLRDSGMPCKERRGQTFRAFVRKLERLGYDVEWRELRACDYGAPTIRKRLFLVARCDGEPIAWPVPTHGKGRALPWRTAAECIDWTIPCHSIFLTKQEARSVGVKRPLAPATMRRIARGIKKFVLDNPHPFVVTVGKVGNWGEERAPYVVPMQHKNSPTSVEDPLQTITTQGNKFNVVSPYLVRTAHGDQDASGKKRGKGEHSLGEPLPSVLATGDFALVAPFLKPRYGENPTDRGGLGQAPRVRSIEEPMPVIVPTGNGGDLVAAFLAKHYGDTGQRPGSGMDEPVSTITACDHNALIAAHIKRDFGTSTGAPVDTPLPTITTEGGGKASLVASFLLSYFEHQQTGDLFEPVPTVLSKDRFALVTVNSVEYVIVDIGMRMLVPRELYRAQGFPDSYVIHIKVEKERKRKGKAYIVLVPLSKTAQVRMVGNSVSPPQARAIIAALFGKVESDEERVAA